MRSFVGVLAVILPMTACGDGGEDGDRAAASSTTTAASTTTAPSTTATPGSTGAVEASLSETSTCADFLGASDTARENATRAALIVFRRGAGVEREPSAEVREEFETVVSEVCKGRQSAGMLDAMEAVAGVGQGTYLR